MILKVKWYQWRRSVFWRPLATHKIYIKHCGSRWLWILHRWKDFSGLTAHGGLYSWGCPVALLGLSLSDIWVPRQMIIKQIRIARTGLIVGSILGGAPVTLLGLSRKGDRWTPQEIRDWSTVPPCKPNVFFPYAPKAMTSSEGKDESVEFFGHQNWHRPK